MGTTHTTQGADNMNTKATMQQRRNLAEALLQFGFYNLCAFFGEIVEDHRLNLPPYEVSITIMQGWQKDVVALAEKA
jgi:hypothetical protein